MTQVQNQKAPPQLRVILCCKDLACNCACSSNRPFMSFMYKGAAFLPPAGRTRPARRRTQAAPYWLGVATTASEAAETEAPATSEGEQPAQQPAAAAEADVHDAMAAEAAAEDAKARSSPSAAAEVATSQQDAAATATQASEVPAAASQPDDAEQVQRRELKLFCGVRHHRCVYGEADTSFTTSSCCSPNRFLTATICTAGGFDCRNRRAASAACGPFSSSGGACCCCCAAPGGKGKTLSC